MIACPATYGAGTDPAACATPIDLADGGVAASFDFASIYGVTTAKCIRVSATQAVTFTGVNGLHPIAPQDCGPVNVFPMEVAISPVLRTFPLAGNYGIHCTNHGGTDGSGMAMQILVVP